MGKTRTASLNALSASCGLVLFRRDPANPVGTDAGARRQRHLCVSSQHGSTVHGVPSTSSSILHHAQKEPSDIRGKADHQGNLVTAGDPVIPLR